MLGARLGEFEKSSTYSLMDTAKSITTIYVHPSVVKSIQPPLNALTKEVSHQDLICQRMLRANGNEGLGLLQGLKPCVSPLSLSPFHFLLDMMEEGDDIAQAILNIDVAICYG